MSKLKKTLIDNISHHQENRQYHIPVLLKEAIDGLAIKPDGVYVDCTFGGGGHSSAILKHLNSDGKLFVFDQDESAKQNLPEDKRIVFIQQNFRYIQKFLRIHDCLKVDGILADLGVSSYQFDEPERGFSIRFDADLDMRMDIRQSKTAANIIASYNEHDLQKLFEKYGEVTNAKTLAKLIVSKRNAAAIHTIAQLKQAVQPIVKGNPNKYFAQVFQALRIEVNDEIGALKTLLSQSIDLLKPNGRIAIITFHSLEDRVVKNFFKTGSVDPVDVDDVFGTRPENRLSLINKKPMEASEIELASNSRSRSAKLRIAAKIN